MEILFPSSFMDRNRQLLLKTISYKSFSIPFFEVTIFLPPGLFGHLLSYANVVSNNSKATIGRMSHKTKAPSILYIIIDNQTWRKFLNSINKIYPGLRDPMPMTCCIGGCDLGNSSGYGLT